MQKQTHTHTPVSHAESHWAFTAPLFFFICHSGACQCSTPSHASTHTHTHTLPFFFNKLRKCTQPLKHIFASLHLNTHIYTQALTFTHTHTHSRTIKHRQSRAPAETDRTDRHHQFKQLSFPFFARSLSSLESELSLTIYPFMCVCVCLCACVTTARCTSTYGWQESFCSPVIEGICRPTRVFRLLCRTESPHKSSGGCGVLPHGCIQHLGCLGVFK